MWPGFDFRSRSHMWVEFVVGSRPCSERFFSGYSSFPLVSKTSTSKFQLDLERTFNTFKRASKCFVGKQIKLQYNTDYNYNTITIYFHLQRH